MTFVRDTRSSHHLPLMVYTFIRQVVNVASFLICFFAGVRNAFSKPTSAELLHPPFLTLVPAFKR